jgi:formate/nitrite transporter FocA (FNT family)
MSKGNHPVDASHARLVTEAQHEVEPRSIASKWFTSAVGGGLLIAFSFIGAAAAAAAAPEGLELLAAALAYPIGFVLVIGGHYQLFTENTLAPVARVLERLTSLPRLVWMWVVVLAGNLVGAGAVGAFLAIPGILPPAVRDAAPSIMSVVHPHEPHVVFGRAVLAGWLIASLVWLMHRMERTSPLLLIVAVTAFMPLLSLEHVVVGTVEAVYAALLGMRPATALLGHQMITLVGNIVGGVGLVTLVNHARTAPVTAHTPRLGWRALLTTFGPDDDPAADWTL